MIKLENKEDNTAVVEEAEAVIKVEQQPAAVGSDTTITTKGLDGETLLDHRRKNGLTGACTACFLLI